ncbi:dihydrodipicolinate synthase family protein [Nocardia sp. CS682]|uniref:dihydrodipicolinate synthase family protein n=1 Tax=Nocardia sp. CS682 TaxID=1047172 RepID=UPI0010757D57|nr:dihydrodipicolinate synthase family protein [Nocardia sp. CS682]QBS46531.1 dihydrodipicolinate synthase family protein [Nocardia sp. CS682]
MSDFVSGIVAYPVTPFSADSGKVDEQVLRALVDRLVEAGVDAVAPLGSTGESAYLDDQEWAAVASICVEQVDRRVPTVVGVSELTTAGTIARARLAERLGATALMMLPVAYWRLTEDELRRHFTAVADAVALPVMAYNNPGTSGIDMSPEFLVDLVAGVDNITMIKESSGDIARMRRIAELGGAGLPFFNGSNRLALQAFDAGAAGWCTAAACLVPERITEVWRLLRAGDSELATKLFGQLEPLLTALTRDGLPRTVKAGLRSLGIDVGDPRPPLLPVDDDTRRTIAELIAAAAR